MLRLVLFLCIGTTLAGIGVIAALTMGFYDIRAISVSASIGAVVGLVISWILGGRLQDV